MATEPASLLHPETIRAVARGDASPNERLHLLRTVADAFAWRAGECEALDLWGDALESAATAQAIRSITDPPADPAQIAAALVADPFGPGGPAALVQRIGGGPLAAHSVVLP